MAGTTERGTNAATAGGGLGFVGALTITFIVLKLCGVVSWSWWWVLSPAWISFAVTVVLLLAGAAIVWALGSYDRRTTARRRAVQEARGRRRTGQPRPHEHGPAHRWGRRGPGHG